MSEPTVVIIVHLVATSKEARDQLLDSLHIIAEYSKAKEQAILKYAICVPDDEKNETSIYVIEEYTNQKALDAHMSVPPVTSFMQATKNDPPLLSDSTRLYTVSWTPAILSRPDRLPDTGTGTHNLRNRVENPYVLFAIITDPDQRDIDTLEPYGAAIVDFAAASEPDTIFYADAKPKNTTPENPENNVQNSFICAVEVYASKAACEKHLQDETVKNLAIEGNKLGSKFEIIGMNMKEGWLIRE